MKTVRILIVISILFSCRNEIDNVDYTVIIGENSRHYIIVKPNPVILITNSHQDSIDLNADGIFEIRFKISSIPTSTVPGSKTEIITQNNLQILLSKKGFEDPDTLNFRSNLKADLHWSTDETQLNEDISNLFTLRSYACYTINHCLTTGNFDHVLDKYIGYKLGEKFGWILVDSNSSELKVKEFTVLK